jgi:hypothetical protein
MDSYLYFKHNPFGINKLYLEVLNYTIKYIFKTSLKIKKKGYDIMKMIGKKGILILSIILTLSIIFTSSTLNIFASSHHKSSNDSKWYYFYKYFYKYFHEYHDESDDDKPVIDENEADESEVDASEVDESEVDMSEVDESEVDVDENTVDEENNIDKDVDLHPEKISPKLQMVLSGKVNEDIPNSEDTIDLFKDSDKVSVSFWLDDPKTNTYSEELDSLKKYLEIDPETYDTKRKELLNKISNSISTANNNFIKNTLGNVNDEDILYVGKLVPNVVINVNKKSVESYTADDIVENMDLFIEVDEKLPEKQN